VFCAVSIRVQIARIVDLILLSFIKYKGDL
jgi:hypothetical protein